MGARPRRPILRAVSAKARNSPVKRRETVDRYLWHHYQRLIRLYGAVISVATIEAGW